VDFPLALLELLQVGRESLEFLLGFLLALRVLDDCALLLFNEAAQFLLLLLRFRQLLLHVHQRVVFD
jgi:hypothetical protein